MNTTRTHTAPSYAVSEELVFTTKQKDEKLLIKNTSVTDTQVLKMPLAMDVTANDGLEEQFGIFRAETKEANCIFNFEELGITTLFTYLRVPFK